MDATRPFTEADRKRIEQEALNAYYSREPEALLRLIRQLLSQLPKDTP